MQPCPLRLLDISLVVLYILSSSHFYFLWLCFSRLSYFIAPLLANSARNHKKTGAWKVIFLRDAWSSNSSISGMRFKIISCVQSPQYPHGYEHMSINRFVTIRQAELTRSFTLAGFEEFLWWIVIIPKIVDTLTPCNHPPAGFLNTAHLFTATFFLTQPYMLKSPSTVGYFFFICLVRSNSAIFPFETF